MSTRLTSAAAGTVWLPPTAPGRASFWATVHRVKQPRSPDAALLALCARLERMRAEWQRLWLLTSDGANLETEADHAWQAYSDTVWPGIAVSDHVLNRLQSNDLPGRLRTLRATTPEGLKAKAQAVMALDNAASYCDCRNDAAQLWESVVADAAGHNWPCVGEEASIPLRPVPPGP